MNVDRLRQALAALEGRRVVVIGDLGDASLAGWDSYRDESQLG